MNDLVLNFTNYIHAIDMYFPNGKIAIQYEDGNFYGVKTALVFRGEPRPEQEFSFADRSPATLRQLAVLRTWCLHARCSIGLLIRDSEDKGTIPLRTIQLNQSALAFNILDHAINVGFGGTKPDTQNSQGSQGSQDNQTQETQINTRKRKLDDYATN